MITIACVYWADPTKGTPAFPEWWVLKLQEMVSTHITVPHKFVCLSNVDLPCEVIPLKHNWKGWWSKIELFRPGVFEGRVLYLDLDTIILDNIDEMCEREESFIGLRAFNPARSNRPGYFASGILSWESGYYDFIYNDFNYDEDPLHFNGDQDYMVYAMFDNKRDFFYWQELVDGIYSYKFHIQNRMSNGMNPMVVCFHGKPRPHDMFGPQSVITL